MTKDITKIKFTVNFKPLFTQGTFIFAALKLSNVGCKSHNSPGSESCLCVFRTRCRALSVSSSESSCAGETRTLEGKNNQSSLQTHYKTIFYWHLGF